MDYEQLLTGLPCNRKTSSGKETRLATTLKSAYAPVRLLLTLTRLERGPAQGGYTLTVELASPCCGSAIHWVTVDRRKALAEELQTCACCGALLGKANALEFGNGQQLMATWDRWGHRIQRTATLPLLFEEWLQRQGCQPLELPLMAAEASHLLEELVEQVLLEDEGLSL